MQQGNFIAVFLDRHVSGTYAHHHAWVFSDGMSSGWYGSGIWGNYRLQKCTKKIHKQHFLTYRTKYWPKTASEL